MATGDYCTLGELKTRLWPDGATVDDTNDVQLASIIAAVSREIDMATGTRWYTTTADETRYYTTNDPYHCYIDQATSITTVATDAYADRTYAYTWTLATDYELYPSNETPYYRIDVIPALASYTFPTGARAVKVIGKFGFDTSVKPVDTDARVKEACVIQSLKEFKSSPLGVIGPNEAGLVSVVPGWHPDAWRILKALKVNMT